MARAPEHSSVCVLVPISCPAQRNPASPAAPSLSFKVPRVHRAVFGGQAADVQ